MITLTTVAMPLVSSSLSRADEASY